MKSIINQDKYSLIVFSKIYINISQLFICLSMKENNNLNKK